MKLFNIWSSDPSRKCSIRAFDEEEALDLYCEMHGWQDYAEFCAAKGDHILSIETA